MTTPETNRYPIEPFSKRLLFSIPALTVAMLIFYVSSLEDIDLPLDEISFNDLMFHFLAYFFFGLSLLAAAYPWQHKRPYPLSTLIILILIGVVVNNGIVLVDHINQLRAKGIERTQAIIQAGRDRMRPILMTAGTTVLSLVPLSIGRTQIAGDGPPYFPMARAIVGGLTFCTVITLLILPTIYVLLDDLRNWSRKIVKKAKMKEV